MSEEDKTLTQTISDAVEKSNGETIVKEEGISKDSQEETNSGEPSKTEPVYVSGIDVSDIPEADRVKLTPLLEKKAKLLEDGYQTKFQEVAKFRKAQEELVKLGLDVDEARDVLVKHIEQKKNPQQTTAQKKEAAKLLDKLLNSIPSTEQGIVQRKTLEDMRQIILEETEVPELKKQIQDLQNVIKELGVTAKETKVTKVNTHLNSLAQEYGQELIDKYRNNFIDAHINYKIPLEKLFTAVIPLEEIKQAILSKVTPNKKPITQEKKNAITSKPDGISSEEKIDIKSKSLKGLITDLVKK